MRIAVYSGSFDPLHIGHMAIMEYLTTDREFDWVYLVISPQNPCKDPSKALNAEQRYKAAIDAVRHHTELHVWVDNIEMQMPAPHYTIKTLDALKQREPENEVTLVIGADNLAGIHEWKDFPRILKEYGVAVYPRAGYDLEATRKTLMEECRHLPEPEKTYRIEIIDAPIVNISSTEIRDAEAKGIDMSEYLM